MDENKNVQAGSLTYGFIEYNIELMVIDD